MTEPMVSMRDVEKAFGELHVLQGIHVDVPPGQKVAIIGASGSGKSTLLRILMTLEQPTAGSVRVNGKLLWEVSDGTIAPSANEQHAVRADIGMVFQHFNLFPHMTVLRNVSLAPNIVSGLAKEEAEARAVELLTMVGLQDKLGEYPAKLSGGQKQRVAIARALAMQPRLMLFDEVTSALDPELVGEVLNVVRDLAHREDMTMLVVTHEMRFAQEVADRVLFLDGGRILEDDAPDVVFRAPTHARTQEFLASVLAN